MKLSCFTLVGALTFASGLGLGPAYAQRGPAVPPTSHAPAQIPPGAGAKGATPTTQTVAQRIGSDPQLAARLTPLLPAGMTFDQAAEGFKNQGRFIAALHVSHNLDIPFDTLKGEMTGPDHKSLGAAIHDLKPSADAKTSAREADAEAQSDLKASTKKPGSDGSK
jgi:hypothetical protein